MIYLNEAQYKFNEKRNKERPHSPVRSGLADIKGVFARPGQSSTLTETLSQQRNALRQGSEPQTTAASHKRVRISTQTNRRDESCIHRSFVRCLLYSMLNVSIFQSKTTLCCLFDSSKILVTRLC